MSSLPNPADRYLESRPKTETGRVTSGVLLRHRRDIDGLRALAVVPVILFHSGASQLPGGFVGVAVFFVISGFLITSLLLRELGRDGRISIVDFYERRARRILPALLLVMIVTCPLTFWLLVPHQMVDFGQSLIAALAMLSNMLFFLESGYFEPEAINKPLLHTWSLAVEEQYYVLFPLALALLYRARLWRSGWIFGAVLLTSFLYSLWVTPTNPAWGFYSLPTRAWELLAGAALAGHMSRGAGMTQNGSSYVAELGSAIGLALILASVLWLDEGDGWPSAWTLLPVTGTVLLLRYNVYPTRVARLLSHPLPVCIGLLSYSAYLWHQPLLALWRINVPNPPTIGFVAGFFAAVMALSYLSWRFVERPFRDRRRVSRRTLVLALSLASASVGSFAAAAIVSDGFVQIRRASLPPAQQALVFDRAELERTSTRRWRDSQQEATRRFAPAAAGTRVLLLGDSMAQDLYATLHQAGTIGGSRQYRWAQLDEACFGLLNARLPNEGSGSGKAREGHDLGSLSPSERCTREVDALLGGSHWPDADHYVLAASWSEEFMDELDATLERIARNGKGATLVNLLEIQEMSSIIMQRGLDPAEIPRFMYSRVRPRTMDRNARLAALAAENGADLVDKFDCFCDAASERCDLVDLDAGEVFVWDHIHLTEVGRRGLVRCMASEKSTEWLVEES